MAYEVTEDELEDLFGSDSNNLKSDALKALKKSSVKSVEVIPDTKVEEKNVEKKKKKHQVGISPRTDVGDENDYSYRDGGDEISVEASEDEIVSVSDKDIDAILGVQNYHFKKDDPINDEKDHIDSFMDDEIEVEEKKSVKKSNNESGESNRMIWDPDEDDDENEEMCDEADAIDDEADAIDDGENEEIVENVKSLAEDDFEFDNGDVEDFQDNNAFVSASIDHNSSESEALVDEEVSTSDLEKEQTLSQQPSSADLSEDNIKDQLDVSNLKEVDKLTDEKNTEEDFVSYDNELSFLDRMRQKVIDSGVCKRASYLDDADLLDFYIEKYETVKFVKVYSPDFDMDKMRDELNNMIVPMFENKIVSLDAINDKLQKVQAYRNRVVEIRLVFLKNYTFRKKALKRLEDNLMKCSKEKSVDKRAGEISVHLGDLEREFDVIDDFYKSVEMVFDNLNHTQDVISRMITCIQERNKRVERGEEPYETPVSETEEFMPRVSNGEKKKSKSPGSLDWEDIDKE